MAAVKPADLRPGDRIAHTVPHMDGTITVFRRPWDDADECRNKNYPAHIARVYVDVEVSDRSTRWDPDNLAAGTGAVDMQWLGMTPTLRYRLVFMPDADVEVCDG